MCLYILKLKFARFGKSFGAAALANRDPKSAPKEPPALFFPILASGSRNRVAQTGRPCPPWAHLLGSLAQPGSGFAHLQLRL
jgi:hypothetical protein